MSDLAPSLLQWFSRHAGFPAHRLAAPAELLVLFAAAAEADEAETKAANSKVVTNDNALLASQRQLAQNRKHAHFKSNNRTKT